MKVDVSVKKYNKIHCVTCPLKSLTHMRDIFCIGLILKIKCKYGSYDFRLKSQILDMVYFNFESRINIHHLIYMNDPKKNDNGT